MVSSVSEGVQISVETFYQQDYSKPRDNEFMFAYRVTIANQNPFPIQILKRHWEIEDSLAERREVDGDGIVGMNPIIPPSEEYQYVSGCILRSEIGTMWGAYEAKNMWNNIPLFVTIPKFIMVAPFKNN